ncbi:unnamed protein product [Enterobius vermicularis]|uniref:Smr domain-containing protein n=1 Tax=Enterobius vermicularis TaxID=51028 RepID=A0A0N4VPW4_ENTVE|nr:unnamed protein product [Enterobius vermicularis]
MSELERQLEAFERRHNDDVLNPEESGRFFEGDIVLDAEQAREIYENAIQHGYRVKRKFIGSELRRWNPRQPIIYSFDGSHSKQMLFAKENKND